MNNEAPYPGDGYEAGFIGDNTELTNLNTEFSTRYQPTTSPSVSQRHRALLRSLSSGKAYTRDFQGP